MDVQRTAVSNLESKMILTVECGGLGNEEKREWRGLHSNVDPTNHEVLFIYLFFLETKIIIIK